MDVGNELRVQYPLLFADGDAVRAVLRLAVDARLLCESGSGPTKRLAAVCDGKKINVARQTLEKLYLDDD